jgi:tetratricopeptide (TPR) repeat protein
MRYTLLLAATMLAAQAVTAQTVREHVTTGDSLHAAMNPAAALKQYEAALVVDPKDYDALIKASRDAVDVGEFADNKDTRTQMYRTGELYARRAVEVNPQGADGHFYLARALGRTAQSLGPKDRVKYAKDVRAHAMDALKIDPKHPGALHVLGMWNAEVMRLSGPTRWFAKNLLGGQVFGSANWDNAVRYMEQAVAVEPNRISHRIDLAKIYLDTKNKARAREEFEAVIRIPATDYNDRFYKHQAEELLKKVS